MMPVKLQLKREIKRGEICINMEQTNIKSNINYVTGKLEGQ